MARDEGHELVIRTKLIPPRPRRYHLERPSLAARLREAQHYRLTLVQASTGYGKSTTVAAALQRAPLDLYWYTLTEPDKDPSRFLLHLIYAFRLHRPSLGDAALQLLREHHLAAVDTYSNELLASLESESVLVLDDYHLVDPSAQVSAIVDRFIEVMPPRLHLVIASRQRPSLQKLAHWRVKGEMLELTQRDLAFSRDEIQALFGTQYGVDLSDRQAECLYDETEGWVIALQIIWQSLQSGVAGSLDQILAELPRSMEDLFSYLAQEVLARRSPHVQDFMLRTSVLRQLDPAICDHLVGWEGSASLLKRFEEENFFVVRLGDSYRYHHLFHDFLRRQAETAGDDLRELHQRAASFYQERSALEEAVHHLLAAGAMAPAAELIAQAGETLVRNGRLDTMSEWVTALPPSILQDYPQLMVQMGELSRFASRFDEALAWYEQAKERYLSQRDIAGAGRALRGQAAVYLDTVRPIKAESLLQEALSLIDGQPDREERAQLLELLAENMTNRGKWEEAEALRQQARELREEGYGRADLGVRVLLRTGRLEEALNTLAQRAAEERRLDDSFRIPRAHRETYLLQSLVYSWQGRTQEAIVSAHRGIQVGRRLSSPFVEAVGYMRLAHAWQITGLPEARARAVQCYEQAIELGDQLAVGRTKVEALWGLCRLHGWAGDLEAAELNATEGIRVGTQAGDEWISALLGMALGASYVMAGRYQAADHWLGQLVPAFESFGDPFGQTLVHLWRALLYHRSNSDQLIPTLSLLLPLAEEHNYTFLFERLTFLGPPDPAELVLPLLAAREGGLPLADKMLRRLGLQPGMRFHPGYTLGVQALGGFSVWRGRRPVEEKEWHREKARQLLQLLLVNARAGRDSFRHREEISDLLWPRADPTSAEQQFKVTLNALQKVLEPERPARAPALFVQRRGSAYGLDPQAPMRIDATAFEKLVSWGNQAKDPALASELFCLAIDLYHGDLLPGSPYDSWCRAERERLHQLYLTTTDKVLERLLTSERAEDHQQAISIGKRVLAIDDCWEPAYRFLMRAYQRQDDRANALRVFERCQTALRDELNVNPSEETVNLYHLILG